MMRLVRLLSFFSVLIAAGPAALAQQVLTINVIDLNEQTRSGLTIKCKEGCAATTSDQNGTAVLALMPENLNAGLVELQVVKRSTGVDWVLISPWDGKWPVAKRSLTAVIARRGDKQILVSGKAVEAVTARVLKEVTPKLDRQISDEERKLVLKQQAEAVGLKPEDVDQAIREWGKKATDPYQQGLAALYEKNFPKAVELLNESYRMREEAAQKPIADLADAAFFLGQALYQQGKYGEAVAKFQRVRSLKGEDAVVLSWLGGSLEEAGRYDEAEPLLKLSIDIREKGLGKDHPATANALNNLGGLYYRQGRYGEAEPLFKRALDIREKSLGKEHPDTAATLNNLAVVYEAQGRYGEVEALYKRAIEIDEKVLGKEHPKLAVDLSNLAGLYKRQRRYGEAESLHKRALDIDEKALGKNHPGMATDLNNLAGVYYDQGRYGEAEPLFKRALDIVEATLGREHPTTATIINNLGVLYKMQGRYGEAESLHKRALDIDEKALGKNHPRMATDLNNLAGVYYDQGRYGEAEPLFKRALDIYERALGSDHPSVAIILDNYAVLLRAAHREEEAAKLEGRAQAIRDKAGRKPPN